MEVIREQYKMVALGPKSLQIPSEWNMLTIEDCSSLKGRIGWQGLTTKEYLKKGDYYLVTGTDFKNGRINWEKCHYVTQDRYDQDSKIQIKKEDLLITKDGTIGKVAFIDKSPSKPTTLNSGVFVLRPTNGDYYPSFMYHYLCSNFFTSFIAQIKAGSTIAHLYQKDFNKFSFITPSLPEQQKIAEILSTVDEQISTTQAIIDKSKELKKGLMQKLFSEGIGHTEFKDSKVGKIPKDWEVVKIGKVADCFGGTTPSTIVEEYWDGDILWATPSDITKNKSEYLLKTSRKITEQGRASKNLRFVQKNGLLMTSRASIGFLNISNGDVVTNQGFINIECKSTYHYKFFYYWIINNRNQLIRFSQGSTFLELYRKTFAKINIHLPPLLEQQKIADILSEADAKIEKEEQEKSQLEQLKKGLMQQLLTGQKRVKV